MAHARNHSLIGDPNRPAAEILSDPAEIQALLAQIAWPSHEPIQFLRYRGTASPADEERYRQFHTVENLERLHRLGCRIPSRFHLHKGFGLQHERPEIEKTIACAKWLHAHDMKISIYIGGTIFTSFFVKERPAALSWRRVDQDGQPVTYAGYQLSRHCPCLNHPDYRAYVKEVLDVALHEVAADEIFFDNQILRYEPRSCRCEHCIAHLRKMVAEKYTPEERERRYGFQEPPDLLPPIFSQANKPWRMDEIHYPAIQDWIDHRCSTVFEFYAEMRDYVKARRPATVVGMNIKGIHGHNRAFDHGIDHNLWNAVSDFTCLDSGQAHSQMKGPALISEIRTFKGSHANKMNVSHGADTDLAIAEHQVFGYRRFVDGFGWLGHMEEARVYSPLCQWFRRNQALFVGRRHRFDLLSVRASSSTNYNCATVHENLYPAEQALIVNKIPWSILFDCNIDEADAWQGARVVLLAEQQALSDRWLDRLERFVREGGGVVATGGTAQADGWYRPRTPGHGLARFLGHAPGKTEQRATLGKGRFVYLPKLNVPYQWNFADWDEIGGARILPIGNWTELHAAIRFAAGGALRVETDGPESVTFNAIDGANADELTLHYINYAPAAAGHLDISVALPTGQTKATVEALYPDTAAAPQTTVQNGRLHFSWPVPDVYTCLQVRFG
ncbi:MAG: hypothetical protein ACREJ2_03960 [Planctomycetota bacterium]